jgi:oligoendopeptidase F
VINTKNLFAASISLIPLIANSTGSLLCNVPHNRSMRPLACGDASDYLKFLSLGGSDYPIEELKVAGIDLTKPEPVADALKVFDESLSELEAILLEEQ